MAAGANGAVVLVVDVYRRSGNIVHDVIDSRSMTRSTIYYSYRFCPPCFV